MRSVLVIFALLHKEKRILSLEVTSEEVHDGKILKKLVTDMEIKNMGRLMDFGSILKDWKNNNGNTNNGWPTF